MGRVAALGCALCRRLGYGVSPAELHHPRTGAGMAMRAKHALVIPLCVRHHRDYPGSLHAMGRRAWEREYRVTELELAAQTQREANCPNEWLEVADVG